VQVPTLQFAFSYPDAAKAQAVLQKLIEQVYEENRKYRGDQSLGTTEFLAEQLATAEEEMLAAEERLGEIQEAAGGSASRTKTGEVTGRLYVVDSRLRDLRHDQRGTEERRELKRAELEQADAYHKKLETRPLEYYRSAVEQMESHWRQADRLLIARSNLSVLQDKWADGYPDLVAAENEVKNLEQVLAEQTKFLENSLKRRDLENSAAAIAKLRLELRALESQSAANSREEADLKAEAQRLREQMAAPAGVELELLAAKREYEVAKAHHEQLLRKHMESKAASDLERRGQGEAVELLEPATLPSQTAPPKLWVRFFGAMMAGFLFGILGSLAHFFAAPRILHSGHLENWAGLPVLASFDPPAPEPRRWNVRLANWVVLLALSGVLSGCAAWTDSMIGAAGFVARGKAEEQKGKLPAAMLYYRQAMKHDSRYGPAYEAAANLALRMGELPAARDLLVRAVEFQPQQFALQKALAEVSYQIYFADPGRPVALLREVEDGADRLMKQWPQNADGYRLAAQVLLERHRLEEASSLLRSAADKIQANATLRSQLAAIEFRRGLIKESEEILRQLIADQPGYGDAYDILYLQLMQKQNGAAAREVLAAKWHGTRRLEAALQLAAHDDASGQRARAKEFLASLRAHAAEHNLGYAALGDFWLHRGEWALSRQEYQFGLEAKQGQRPEYVGRIAEWHLLQNQRKEAKSLIEAEFARYPESPVLGAYLAALRVGDLAGERRAEERRRLENIVARMPDSAFVRYHLGRAYLLENKLEAASENFERSIKLDANYTAGWLALAELEMARGNAVLAEARAQQALRSNQNNTLALLIQGKAQVSRGRVREAQESFRRALASDPGNPEASYGFAVSAAAQGNWKEAEPIFAEGARKEPANPRWILSQAATMIGNGRAAAARTLLETATRDAASPEVIYQQLAEVQLLMRDGESARSTFQKLLEMKPGNLNYTLGLAGALALAGKQDRALELYRSLQQQHPSDVRVWLEPASLLDEMGRTEAAIEAYKQALVRQKDHPIALNNLAWRLLEQGKELPLALEYAQAAKRLLPRSAEIGGTLAEAYMRLEMPRNATAIYEEMLEYADEQSKPKILKQLEEARRRSARKSSSA
jgi:tetratricopeptide (TPR) repeat protein